jgi:hypothetical protein
MADEMKHLTTSRTKEIELLIEKYGHDPAECALHIAEYVNSVIEFNRK